MIIQQAYPLWVRTDDGDKSGIEIVIAWKYEEGKSDKPVPITAKTGEVPAERASYFLSSLEEVAAERRQIQATSEALNRT
jgi:hypothetical protein